jgi:hypothetical protein
MNRIWNFEFNGGCNSQRKFWGSLQRFIGRKDGT